MGLYLSRAFYVQLAVLAGCWLSLLFNPEDIGSMFLRNVGELLLD
jgi:hypothetical protein